MIFLTPPSVSDLYCFASNADYIHRSSTHWYRRYYRYRSLCPDRQGLVKWRAGVTILSLYNMVNPSLTGDICFQQLTQAPGARLSCV